MSPDDIFAAQFWPWPDPAIKRDAQGRILFVNAAFLALYGGRVEDWRGNAVGGWPAPQANGQNGVVPYRFETRLPVSDGSEQVYDWMEQTLADGNAFALARNVTVFLQTPDPDPAHVAAPVGDYQTSEAEQQPAVQADTAAQNAPAYQPAFQAENAAPAIEAPEIPAAPVFETQTPEIQAIEPPAANVPAVETQPDPIAVPEIEIPNIAIPSDDAYAMTEAPAAAPPAPEPEPEREREYERRALPIGAESAVLGNNWRDAVIAKAVGADEVAADAATTMGADTELAAATEAAEVQADGAKGPIRILLAEDNAINALLTRTLLEAEGHTVDTVEDGVLAVEAMKTAKYDLIFMDMRMPNMDGLEATRKIRALPNVSKALPIVALTANAFDDDRNACFDSGMNDFMTKPVSAEELSEKVSDWTSEEAKERMRNAA